MLVITKKVLYLSVQKMQQSLQVNDRQDRQNKRATNKNNIVVIKK